MSPIAAQVQVLEPRLMLAGTDADGFVIIDNVHGEYAEAGSGWANSSLQGSAGSSTRYSASADATARWKAGDLAAGWYAVDVYNVGHSSSTTDARVTVAHADGNDTHSLNQRTTRNGYVTLGVYRFSGGASQSVAIANGAGGGVLRADAVRFRAASVIDNGDAGYSEEGTWFDSLLAGSNGSATRYSQTPGAAVQWDVDGVEAGWYAVEIYNVGHSLNSTSVSVETRHAGRTSTITYNPKTTETGWEHVDTFWFDGSGNEHVRLVNSVDGTILRADAVRLQQLSSPRVVDEGDAGYAEGRDWYDSRSLVGVNGSGTRYSFSERASVRWSRPSVEAGWYTVELYNVAHELNTTAARVETYHAGARSITTLDQLRTPTGWTEVGTFYFAGVGDEHVRLVNTLNGPVLRADAARFRPVVPPVGRKVDDTRVEFSEGGVWQGSSLSGSDGTTTRYSTTPAATAQWNLPIVDAGWYAIDFFNVAHVGNTSSVRVEVHHAGGTAVQSLNPRAAGAGWTGLGSFYLEGTGDEYVRLSNLVAGTALRADAVRLRAVAPPSAAVLGVGGSSYFEGGGGWFDSGLRGVDGSRTRYSASPSASVRWAAPALAGWYTVEFYNVRHSSNTAAALFETRHSGGVSSQFVNQRDTPTGWARVGTYFFDGSPGSYARLANTMAGTTLRANAIRFVAAAPPQSKTVADGGADYFESQGWLDSGLTGAGGSGSRYSTTSRASVRWNVTDVAPGWYAVETYNVGHAGNSASVLVETRHAGSTTSTVFDQRATPTGWATLGTYYFDGRSFESVRMVNLGSGIIRADSLRLRAAPPPALAIVDNGAAGYAEGGSGWQTSGLAGFGGGNSRYSSAASASVRWNAPRLAAGWYAVEVYNVTHGANTTAARAEVSHAGSISTAVVDQRSRAAGWVGVGTHYFDGRAGEWVRLVNTVNGTVLRADAVRFRSEANPSPALKANLPNWVERGGLPAISDVVRPKNSAAFSLPLGLRGDDVGSLVLQATSDDARVRVAITGTGSTARVVVTPAAGFVGEANVFVAVTDPNGYGEFRRFAVSLVNRAPSIQAVSQHRLLRGSGAHTILVNATDPDGDAVDVFLESSVLIVGTSFGVPFIESFGAAAGTHEVTIVARDSAGAETRETMSVVIDAATIVKTNSWRDSDQRWNHIALDANGNLYRYRNDGSLLEYDVLTTDVRDFELTSSGRLYVLTDEGVLQQQAADGTWTTYDFGTSSSVVEEMTRYDDDLVLALRSRHVVRLDLVSGTWTRLVSGVTDYRSLRKNFWALTERGELYRIHPTHGVRLILSNDDVTAIAATYGTGGDEDFLNALTDEGVATIADRDSLTTFIQYPGIELGATDPLIARERVFEAGRKPFALFQEGDLVTINGYGDYTHQLAGVRDAVAAFGRVYALRGTSVSMIIVSNGSIQKFSDVISGVRSLHSLDGTLYVLKSNGRFLRYEPSILASPTELATHVAEVVQFGKALFVRGAEGRLYEVRDGSFGRIDNGIRDIARTADRLFMLTSEGLVHRYDSDTGERWTRVRGIPGDANNTYIALAAGRERVFALRSEDGRLYNSPDGSSWFFTNGKTLEVVDHLGQVFIRKDDQKLRRRREGGFDVVGDTEWDGIASSRGYMLLWWNSYIFNYVDDDLQPWLDVDEFQAGQPRRDWLHEDLLEFGGEALVRNDDGTISRFTGDPDDSWEDATPSDSQSYDKIVVAGSNLYGLRSNGHIYAYDILDDAWSDVSIGTPYQNSRFTDIARSLGDVLVGTLSGGDKVVYTGESWTETIIVNRRGRELYITGRENKADVVSLTKRDDNLIVTVNDVFAQEVVGAPSQDTLKEFRFRLKDIDRVTIRLFSGNDTVDATNSPVAVRLYGGDGVDTLKGIVGRDRIYGEGGRDDIHLVLDIENYAKGRISVLNNRSDVVGDDVTLFANLGDTIRTATSRFHDYISPRLRPVTDFFDTKIVSIPELGPAATVTWRDVARKNLIPGLRGIERIERDLLTLDDFASSLPETSARQRVGTFFVDSNSIGSSLDNPFAGLANSSSVKALADKGVLFPILTDTRQLVRIAFGETADLVTYDATLSQYVDPDDLTYEARIAEGFYAIGPVPMQWWLDFRATVDFGIKAGLDTSGFRSRRVERGFYVEKFELIGTGGVSVGTGWKPSSDITSALSINNVVSIDRLALGVEGTLELRQVWSFGSTSGRVYVFAPNGVRATLTVRNTLTGRLELIGTIKIKAAGWGAEVIDGANQIIDNAEQAYVTVVDVVKDFLGAITGKKYRKTRRPEIEIEKEVTFSETILLGKFEHEFNDVEIF